MGSGLSSMGAIIMATAQYLEKLVANRRVTIHHVFGDEDKSYEAPYLASFDLIWNNYYSCVGYDSTVTDAGDYSYEHHILTLNERNIQHKIHFITHNRPNYIISKIKYDWNDPELLDKLNGIIETIEIKE